MTKLSLRGRLAQAIAKVAHHIGAMEARAVHGDKVPWPDDFKDELIGAACAAIDSGDSDAMIRALRLLDSFKGYAAGDHRTFLGMAVVVDPDLAPGVIEFRSEDGTLVARVENVPADPSWTVGHLGKIGKAKPHGGV